MHTISQIRIVARYYVFLHLGERARNLHAGWPATHDDHIHKFLPFVCVCLRFRQLQIVKNMVAQSHCVADSLHRDRIVRNLLVVKEIGR